MLKQLITILLFSTFLFAEQNSETNTPADYYSSGLKFFNRDNKDFNGNLAFNFFKKAAAAGHTNAQLKLAECYRQGIGTDTNYVKAFKLYKKLAKKNIAEGEYGLAGLYYNGLGILTNKKMAFEWAKKAAEQGMSDAQVQVALAYNDGVGVETNIPEAIKWYKKAAAHGDSAAANNIGFIYETGNGVETNEAEALFWYLKSATQENLTATYNLASFYEKLPDKSLFASIFNPTNKTFSRVLFLIGNQYINGEFGETNKNKSIFWYEKAAEQNSAEAQNILGLIYLNGEIVSQNYNLAFNYFTIAVTQNFADAENSLGYMYQNGLGVKTNYEKAFEWYEKAAAQNNANAQANMGLLYKFGTGIEKNMATSLFYFALSASNGCALSQYELGWRYQDGVNVTQDYKKAVKWYELAEKNGNTDAAYNLAWLYENGLGVPEDNMQALILYLEAAEQNEVTAQEKVARMYYFGNGTMKDYKKAFEWYKKAAKNGNLTSESSLGYLYKHGLGTQTNYNKAFKWYYTAATQNYSIAQYNVGVLYQEGKGTRKNLTNAFKFYLESANNGYNRSQQKIGWSENKKNQTMELTVLTNLYYLFANRENSDAQYGLGLIYEYGTILPQSDDFALKWYLKAAENGDTAAFYRVAIIYDKQKKKKAFNWFVKSAAAGNHYADFKLGYIYYEGKYVAKDFDKALEYFQKVINSEINNDLKGSASLMIGGIQLKQGKTTEGFATLKKAIKYPLVKKIVVVLVTIGVLGGLVFLTAIFLIFYFILKNNKAVMEKKSWSIAEAVAVIGAFVFLQVGMSAMIVVPIFDKICKDVFLKILFWTFIGNIIVIFIAILFAKIRPISVWKQFGFYKVNFKKWLLFVGGSWLFVIFFGAFYEQILKLFNIKIDGQFVAQEVQKYDDAGSIIFLILIIGFVMPVMEELIFRGVLYQALRSKMSVFWSILISSIVFSTVHLDVKYFIPLLAMGFVSAYSFEKTKSIYTPIGIHILNNLVAVNAMIFLIN